MDKRNDERIEINSSDNKKLFASIIKNQRMGTKAVVRVDKEAWK